VSSQFCENPKQGSHSSQGSSQREKSIPIQVHDAYDRCEVNPIPQRTPMIENVQSKVNEIELR
jgi:hypothetical protein